MKTLVLLAVLGLAAPALAADRPVALGDDQLAKVSGGTGSLAPVTNINVNASPIIVTQTAIAVNTQTQTANALGNGHGKGKAFGLVKQAQFGFAAASNVANINYHVVQVNAGG